MEGTTVSRIAIGFALALISLTAYAEDVIEFPEEQLSQESVYPVFDQPEAVKERNVQFTNKKEVSLGLGSTLNDPFFNTYPIELSGYYHFNEYHAAGIVGAYGFSMKNGYVSQIDAQFVGTNRVDFETAPKINWYVLGEYEFTPYYGKISLSKLNVINLTLSLTAGAGTMSLGTDSSVVMSFGMNQRLFFNKRFGIKPELRALMYQQNDVVLTTPEKKGVLNFVIGLAALYLF